MQWMLEQMRRSMQRDPSTSTSQLESGRETDLQSQSRSEMNLTVEPVDDGHIATADLPGFEKDEIEVRFDDDVLSIRGVQEHSEEQSEEGMMSRRRQRRQTHEQVRMPAAIDEEAISASYRNGVLEVHLPTREDTDAEDDTRIDID
jgi:HSP20 family protein